MVGCRKVPEHRHVSVFIPFRVSLLWHKHEAMVDRGLLQDTWDLYLGTIIDTFSSLSMASQLSTMILYRGVIQNSVLLLITRFRSSRVIKHLCPSLSLNYLTKTLSVTLNNFITN
jgi:hypothetical protein